MKKHRWLIPVLCCASLFTAPISFAQVGQQQVEQNRSAAHPALALQGSLTQGALLRGQVKPGSKVWLNGEPLRVTAEGQFVFGTAREAPLRQTLKVESPRGAVETHQLDLQKREYDIQRISGVAKKHVNPDPAQLARVAEENKLTRSARKADSDLKGFLQPFIWPASGRISGVFGSQRIFNGEPRAPHSGVDVAAPKGAPVVAPAAGVVTLVHPDMFFSGGTLIVDHGLGVSSTFIHLSEVLVEPGQAVAQGDLIARVGATGRATGPHLHWNMNWFDVRVDPALIAPPTVGGATPPMAPLKKQVDAGSGETAN